VLANAVAKRVGPHRARGSRRVSWPLVRPRRRCRAVDFQFDRTLAGRQVKLLNVVDEFTREALAMQVARNITADDTVKVLEHLAATRGAPGHTRWDNGTELTAHALRDSCRFAGAGTAFIEPGAPWQNPFVESFDGRVRDELLDVERFLCLAEARS
jgi:putative transposase